MIEDLKWNPMIASVENTEAVKAHSGNFGEAFVEYSVEVGFRAGDKLHKIKLTAYTTTCSVMIQPLGEASEGQIGNRFVSRYFAEEFFFANLP